jgi:hypothetical protein
MQSNPDDWVIPNCLRGSKMEKVMGASIIFTIKTLEEKLILLHIVLLMVVPYLTFLLNICIIKI